MTFPPMRPQLELQRVHDLIHQVLGDEDAREAVSLPPDLLKPLIMAADVLCWALHHDTSMHPDAGAHKFAEMIFWFEHDLAEAGLNYVAPGPYIIEED